MTTMRIISINAADRATLAVPNTAPGLGADNLKTDIKGQVCRVLGNAASIAATWPSLETVGAVVIPASNLGPSSTIRVRAYADEAGTKLLQDTGKRWAAPGPIFANEDFTQPLNVNSFAFGAPLNVNSFAFGVPPITAVYLSQHEAVCRLVIDMEDPAAEFIDLSRLIVGRYFEPRYNPEYGQSDGVIDMSTNSRAASGDIKTDAGPRAKRMSFNLALIANEDRAQVLQILQRGIGKWLFISLLPGHADAEKERDKSIYGKPSSAGSMSWAYYSHHAATFEIEGF